MGTFTNEQAIAAIRNAKGLLAIAARELGTSRRSLYKRLEKHEALRRVLNEEREHTTDVAESKLLEAINNGEFPAIRFYLICQAKARGYVEKYHVEEDVNLQGKLEVDVNDARARLIKQLGAVRERIGLAPFTAAEPDGNGGNGRQ